MTMDPNQLEGLPRLAFDVAVALLKPLFAFNQYDSFLYWPFLLVALSLALLVFLLNRDDGPRSFLLRYFSKTVWGHPSAKADYKFYYVNGVLFPAVFAPLILSGAWLGVQVHDVFQALFGQHNGVPASAWITTIYTLAFFLVYDFGRYLAHYLQHRIDFLWHFHKVHHSAEVLTPFTAFRAHPVDLVIMATFPAATTGIINGIFNYWTGGSTGLYLFFGLHILIFIYNLVGNLRHTHVWLSYGPFLNLIFISPAQHQIHHSIEQHHWGRNMGFALAFWDKLFGTLYVPHEHEHFEIGLGDGTERHYHGVIGMYWRPVRELFMRNDKSHGLTRDDG